MVSMTNGQFKTVCDLIYDWGASDQDVLFKFEECGLTSKLVVIFSDGNDMFYEMDLNGEIIVSCCDDV